MERSFENKVVFITGAGSGIGLETARAFAKAGAKVALADLNVQAVQEESEKLNANGNVAIGIDCNVADEKSVADAVKQTVDTFGSLDIAFNNAGIQAPVATFADASSEDFDRVIAVNLRGVWSSMKYELQQMEKQGSGVIVNCSSQDGVVGAPGLGAYTASKHGVIGLTKSAALEYAPKGIRINAICRGVSDTPMVAKAFVDEPDTMKAVMSSIPLGRVGHVANEIASTVLWLSSPGAGFVIGQAIVVDGGYTAH